MGFDINKDGEGKEDKKKGFSLDKDDVGSDDKKSGGFDLDKDGKSGSTGEEKGSKKGMIVGLLVVAALVVVGFLMFGGGDTDAETANAGEAIAANDEGTEANSVEGEVEYAAVSEDDATDNVAEYAAVSEDDATDNVAEDATGSDASAQEDMSSEVENDGASDAVNAVPTISEGEMVNIPVISFSQGSASDVTDENSALVDKIVNYLNSNQSKKLVVYGYASSEGGVDINQRISKARADKFASLIRSKGISSSRIRTVGKGIENPIASNDPEQGRQKNRRVEISFELGLFFYYLVVNLPTHWVGRFFLFFINGRLVEIRERGRMGFLSSFFV